MRRPGKPGKAGQGLAPYRSFMAALPFMIVKSVSGALLVKDIRTIARQTKRSVFEKQSERNRSCNPMRSATARIRFIARFNGRARHCDLVFFSENEFEIHQRMRLSGIPLPVLLTAATAETFVSMSSNAVTMSLPPVGGRYEWPHRDDCDRFAGPLINISAEAQCGRPNKRPRDPKASKTS